MIKGLLVKPYELPKEIEIEDTLENLQGLVEGNIECVYLQNDRDVVLDLLIGVLLIHKYIAE